MNKEEKLKLIATVNCRFNEVESYLEQLEADEENNHPEEHYSQVVTSARGTLEVLREYFDWYKNTVIERD